MLRTYENSPERLFQKDIMPAAIMPTMTKTRKTIPMTNPALTPSAFLCFSFLDK